MALMRCPLERKKFCLNWIRVALTQADSDETLKPYLQKFPWRKGYMAVQSRMNFRSKTYKGSRFNT
ncbi:hypothetical protein I79_003956 [Cricetulus griseus]|uniref:Uncharacterized protein n=1 Tax=Cricetulus griseus TaxID=10029 RepID=G3H1D1_CRIGR|nr:hypothetical protein I79_003956 [Cricetulus griseus]